MALAETAQPFALADATARRGVAIRSAGAALTLCHPSGEQRRRVCRISGVIGFSSPVARLERDDIYVLRNDAGKIAGGVVIGVQAPFRALETLAPADRVALEQTLDLDDTVEIYGAMLAPELRSGLRSTAFWFAAMHAALHVLCARDAACGRRQQARGAKAAARRGIPRRMRVAQPPPGG